MKAAVKECTRCGSCCNADMTTFAEENDIRRWKDEGRGDILDALSGCEKVWAGDRIVLSSGKKLGSCPFLRRESGMSRCLIYETRPAVCRRFMPGSSRLCPQWEES
ncbi:MAG TPA: YkgJ family cysteine cluster protein [Spirochaetota bacterium]|nr:YkgJ family cysteine cluster protein [Spirochaetota bacterium]HPI87941.1 YkgJ family cysteine cluster protein [Spirochaetota bacterium]HPR46651.1 YkgJ family cysteine cluster protein [Spirochaetota bacterium]